MIYRLCAYLRESVLPLIDNTDDFPILSSFLNQGIGRRLPDSQDQIFVYFELDCYLDNGFEGSIFKELNELARVRKLARVGCLDLPFGISLKSKLKNYPLLLQLTR